MRPIFINCYLADREGKFYSDDDEPEAPHRDVPVPTPLINTTPPARHKEEKK